MKLRRLTPTDAEEYALLRRVMIAQEPYAFLAVPGDDASCEVSRLRESLGREEQAIFGAFGQDGAGLVASAGVYRETRVKRRHRAGIWGVYTSPAARGRGHARGLVRACIDLARTWQGVTCVGLSASVRSEAAIALYESMGFRVWGQEPDATRVGGEPIDEVHMILRLE